MDNPLDTFKSIVVNEVTALALKEQAPQKLLSKEQVEIRLHAEIEKEINAVMQEIMAGSYIIFENIKKVPNELITEAVLNNIDEVITLLENIEDPLIKQLTRDFIDGMPLRIALGIENATLEVFYQTAKILYDEKQYLDAYSAFAFMTTLDPMNAQYWQAMGNCAYFSEKYEEALNLYTTAALSDLEYPLPHLFSAYCHHSLGNNEKAKECCKRAIKAAEDQEEWVELTQEVEYFISLLGR